MKKVLVLAGVLSVAMLPSLSDLGTARGARGYSMMLTESSGPTRGAHDTALVAETESSGPTRGGRDTGQVADASRASPGGRDTALVAETESNGPTRGGRDSAQVA